MRAREARRPRQPQALRRAAAAPAARHRAGQRSRACCSSMSPPPASTRRRAAISGSWCSRSRRGARPSSSPRTTWKKRSCSAMRSRSWIAAGSSRRARRARCCASTSPKCCSSCRARSCPQAARDLPLRLIEAGDRIEITTDDLDGTLRQLMDAQRAAHGSAHPAAQPRGPVPRAHRQGAARMMKRLLCGLACAQSRVRARPRHAHLHASCCPSRWSSA